MDKNIENHTTKKYHYDDFEPLKNRLNDFLMAYNYGKRLKFLTSYQENLSKNS